ncbi:hypothetical protein IKF86_00745 [Candidatus Saccharibacteria bacterium]|nr:hypothetical protein [Candidatus Saccharibacteria bacterium]
MNERKRSNNKFWIIILCVLATIMVGLIAGIVVVQVNRNNQTASEEEGEEENDSTDEDEDDESSTKTGEGEVAPVIVDNGGEESSDENNGSPNETEEEQTQVQNQIAVMNSVKQYLSTLTVDEALSYLDEQIANTVNANDKFGMRLLKINVLNNADRHEEALEEAKKVDNVDELSKWNKSEYYNAMAYTYESLGDITKRNEYIVLYEQAYRDIWGDFTGSN